MGRIFYLIGVGLLLLGFGSGIAIFFRAAFATNKGGSADPALAPLWGLFLSGVIGGAIFLAVAWNYPG